MLEVNELNASRWAAGYWHFIRELVRHPREIGAMCPSSPFLARRMASLVPEGQGLVLELGPGGGVVTAALLSQGIAADDLVLVERSAVLSAHLGRRFPGVKLIHGDAAHLSRFEALRNQPIRAIVSSLPLRSLRRSVVREIMDQISQISGPGTMFIQFTYALRGGFPDHAAGFKRDQRHVVWRNLPPARIDAYRYRSESGAD